MKKDFGINYNCLIEDVNLKSLNKFSEFDRILYMCRKRELEAKSNEKPDLKIILPRKSNKLYKYKYLLISALHGDQEKIKITENYWSSCMNKNYLLALSQSSQIQFTEGFEWKDIEKGSREPKGHFGNILEKHNIDSDNIIIGGFFAGARVALYSNIKNLIQVRGFILVTLWLPEIDKWVPLLDKIRKNSIKDYDVCGDKDNDSYVCTKRFTDLLSSKKIFYKLKILKI